MLQRFIEIWSSLPHLYILIILSAILTPSFVVLLTILLLFSWVSLVHLVRAEFLRARNFEYVNAARALGLSNAKIIVKHVLPNAMVATLTFLPFIVNSSISTLTSLDFLGLGMPPGSPSLGELLLAGQVQPLRALARPLRLRHRRADAVAADLRRRSGARRLRSQKDLLVSAERPLLDVRDLSVAFAQGGRRETVVDRVSFKLERGQALALVGESGLGQNGHRAIDRAPAALPRREPPDGRDLVQGPRRARDERARLARNARRRRHHGVPGADDLAQPAPHHRAADRRDHRAARRARRLDARARRRAARGGRHRRPRRAARRLSPPALRRPAPARDDRDGARQPPGPVHRRRADHRARRHRAGADSQAARRISRRGSAWRCCSSPTTSASCAKSPATSR